MLQFTDNVQTTEVPDKLPDGVLLSDADYNSAFADKPAPHAVDYYNRNDHPYGHRNKPTMDNILGYFVYTPTYPFVSLRNNPI